MTNKFKQTLIKEAQQDAFSTKRDWKYHHTNRYSVADVVQTWQNTLWPIQGKHKDTKLKQLPVNYLGWVIDNFQEESLGYKLAKQELECRWHNMA
jgi:hypothetical protein